MPEKMRLTAGGKTIDFSPLLDPDYNRPDDRDRGFFQASDGGRWYVDYGRKQDHIVSLNNVQKSRADQINTWWQNRTMLDFLPSLDPVGIFAHTNGSSEYFYRTDADFPESGITGATDLTIQLWIKTDSVTGITYDMVTKWAGLNDKRMYRFVQKDDELRFYVSSDGTLANQTVRESTNASLVVGEWTHVAVVYDASAGSCVFYKNGAVLTDDGVALKTSIADKDPDFLVGGVVNNVGAVVDFFDGGFFGVALFTGQRTVGQIRASYRNPSEDLSSADNIIAQWRFNDAAAATFIDNSQGDAGRDLIPNDGGDEIYGNVGRTSGTLPSLQIYTRILNEQRPLQMWYPRGWQTQYEGTLNIHEVSSSSSSA
jgi:hypothetical protein